MDARAYVYAYLVLSALFAAASVQYVIAVSRTVFLARKCVPGENDVVPSLEDPEVHEATQTAVRSVLGVDSAAFVVAVVPVAYVAVTGLLGNLLAANTRAAAVINPLWLLATLAVVVTQIIFVARITGLNNRLKGAAQHAVLTRSFVRRHANMATYYRTFILFATMFVVVNSLYLIANIAEVASLPYVM
jgi:hypothetical protein